MRNGSKLNGKCAYWTFIEPKHAKAWLNNGRRLEAADFLDDGPCVIILGVQGIDTSVVKYLMKNLSDVVLADCDV